MFNGLAIKQRIPNVGVVTINMKSVLNWSKVDKSAFTSFPDSWKASH